MQNLTNNTDSAMRPFGKHEECAIISLLLDFPEIYAPISSFVTSDIFGSVPARYIIAAMSQDFSKYGVVPTRDLLYDRLAKRLTVEDPYEEILQLIKKKSDPREVPLLRETLHAWVEHSVYNMLYSDDGIDAYQRGDYEYLKSVFDKATQISNVGRSGFWFFEQLDELFVEETVEHISTGYPSINKVLNDGGPSKREVVVWMASTGVGKTIMLCNNAVAALKQDLNVLFVTFELSDKKTAKRIAANITDISTKNLIEKQDKVRHLVQSRKKESSLVIYDLPPDECSVDHVYSIIDNLKKTKSWAPDVVILDYLELMVSRRAASNNDDYGKQKGIATEVRGLAKNENVLVYTATQGNRSSVSDNTNSVIDLNKTAESFGKMMPVDYVVSLNQTTDEYTSEPAIIRLWIAKNRNGPKFLSITTNVNYNKMSIKEVM